MPKLGSTGFNKTIFIILFIGTIILILMTYYRFYVVKSYPFLVEAPCNPLYEECSERDCEVDGCPANGLASYKTYEISASDFEKCSDDSCQYECEIQAIHCTSVNE